MTMLVHQELSWPLNWMRLWMSAVIRTPKSAPKRKPSPPVKAIPPMTTAAMTVSSKPVAWVPWPEPT